MFARTKRLTLRPAWPEDAPAVAAAIGHQAVVTRLSHAPWPYTLADADVFVGTPRAATEPVFLVFSHEGETPTLVGCIGMQRDGDAHEIGYWFTPEAWGRGYATEAGTALVAIARDALRLPRLRGRHHLDNPASGRVLRKLGFRALGRVERIGCVALGHDVDAAVLELDLAEDEIVRMPAAA